MFPTKEAGDYFNNNVILIKYQLDLADPDGIMEKYAIRAYPTFIFVDGEGKEYSRFLGGANDAKTFIERTQNAIKPENSWAYREEKLKSDPSYTLEHIKYLNSVYMQDQAKEMLYALFATRSVTENFSKESVSLYNSLITEINSPIIDYMINNQKEVIALMGEEEFGSFLTSKANSHISNKLMRLDIEKPESVKDFETELSKINSTPLFTSKYTRFLVDNLNNIKDKNIEAVFDNSVKLLPELNTADRSMVLSINTNVARICKVSADQDVLNKRMISLFEIAVAVEKDSRYLESYRSTLERLKE